MNVVNGTSLAILQDTLIKNYNDNEPCDYKVIDELKRNLWVKTSYILSPSNLVVRHYALIDILQDKMAHAKEIISLIERLTYAKRDAVGPRLWAEGYSYFCYTMDILKVWVNIFHNKYVSGVLEHSNNTEQYNQVHSIEVMIAQIEQGFLLTSYKSDGVWYPALYGDLRDQPLQQSLQIAHDINPTEISFLKMSVTGDVIRYDVTPRPIGFNTHIPVDKSETRVIGGKVYGFNFYNGYNKKYPNKFAEFFDTFNFKRIGGLL